MSDTRAKTRIAAIMAAALLVVLGGSSVALAASPTVVTEAATEITRSSMTICGTVDPNGEATTYHFNYEYYEAGWQKASTPAESAGAGNTAVQECAHLTGLAKEGNYYYSIVATNAAGEATGLERSAKTAGWVEGIQTEVAGIKRLGSTSEVTLNGSLEPNGFDTHYYFEYATPHVYSGGTVETAPSLPGGDAGEASKVEHVSVTIQVPTNSEYGYRLVGVNQLGTTYGSEMSVLAPAVEGLTTLPATGVTNHSAVLHGSLEPNGYDTHWQFECSRYGQSPFLVPSAPADAGTTTGSVAVEASVSQLGSETTLAGNTRLECRLVASNSLGTDEANQVNFTTLPSVPELTDGEAPVVTSTTAGVSANLRTENEATSYWVEYVDAGQYAPGAADPYEAGAQTQTIETAATLFETDAIARGMTGLTPGTTYHYRFAAENGSGITYGPDRTFTTLSVQANAPRVSTGAASNVMSTGATVSGTVNPSGIQTSYEFEIGASASYGGAEIFGNAGDTAGDEQVSTVLRYLVPGATYHYRLVATNADGTTYGQDETFTTPSVGSPIVQPSSAPLVAFTALAFPVEHEVVTQPAHKKKSKPAHKKKKSKRRKKAARKGKSKKKK